MNHYNFIFHDCTNFDCCFDFWLYFVCYRETELCSSNCRLSPSIPTTQILNEFILPSSSIVNNVTTSPRYMSTYRNTTTTPTINNRLSLGQNICKSSNINSSNSSCNHLNLISSSLNIQRRSMFIRTQDTPNPNSLKFYPGTKVRTNIQKYQTFIWY